MRPAAWSVRRWRQETWFAVVAVGLVGSGVVWGLPGGVAASEAPAPCADTDLVVPRALPIAATAFAVLVPDACGGVSIETVAVSISLGGRAFEDGELWAHLDGSWTSLDDVGAMARTRLPGVVLRDHDSTGTRPQGAPVASGQDAPSEPQHTYRALALWVEPGAPAHQAADAELELRYTTGAGDQHTVRYDMAPRHDDPLAFWQLAEPSDARAALRIRGDTDERPLSMTLAGVGTPRAEAPNGFAMLHPEDGRAQQADRRIAEDQARAVIAARGLDGLRIAQVAPSLLPAGDELVSVDLPPSWTPAQAASWIPGLTLSDGEGAWTLDAVGDVAVVPGRIGLWLSDDRFPNASVGPRIQQSLVLDGAHPAAASVASGSSDGTEAFGVAELGRIFGTATARGQLRLADTGERLVLGYGNVLVDVLSYGDSGDPTDDLPQPSVEVVRPTRTASYDDARIKGRIYEPADVQHGDQTWPQHRIVRQHQRDVLLGEHYIADAARVFVCPDRCYAEALRLIDDAEVSLRVWMYDLSSKEVAEALAAAVAQGVDVQVLLDGIPVGASDDKRARIAWAVQFMQQAGVAVWVHQGARFDHVHAKTLVADGRDVLVTSENANHNGWPPDGSRGNAGWGTVLTAPSLARDLEDLFLYDIEAQANDARFDTIPADATWFWSDPDAARWGPLPEPTGGGLDTLAVSGPITVMPVVSPDHTGGPGPSRLLEVLEGARYEIGFQQLNLPLSWSRSGHRSDSPIIATLDAAMQDQTRIRGHLASAFEDGDPDTPGNDQTAAWFATKVHEYVGHEAAFSGWVRTTERTAGGGIVHNKGWLVDPYSAARGAAFIGSQNGNLASQTMNREIGVWVFDSRVARYFSEALNEQWETGESPLAEVPVEVVRTQQDVAGASAGLTTVALLAALVVVARLDRRQR